MAHMTLGDFAKFSAMSLAVSMRRTWKMVVGGHVMDGEILLME